MPLTIYILFIILIEIDLNFKSFYEFIFWGAKPVLGFDTIFDTIASVFEVGVLGNS